MDFPFVGILLWVFVKTTSEFSDFVSNLVFGFSYLGSGFSSLWAALVLNSHQTQRSVEGKSCYYCIGSTRVLIPGIWKFICFNGFVCGFRFWYIFLQFSTSCSSFLFFWFLIDPNIPSPLTHYRWRNEYAIVGLPLHWMELCFRPIIPNWTACGIPSYDTFCKAQFALSPFFSFFLFQLQAAHLQISQDKLQVQQNWHWNGNQSTSCT